MPNNLAPRVRCLILLPSELQDSDIAKALRNVVQAAGFRVLSTTESESFRMLTQRPSVWGSVATEAVARADCVIADVTRPDSEIYFNLGIADALGKPCFLISQATTPVHAAQLPDQAAFVYYEPNPSGLIELANSLSALLKEHRRFPRRSRFLLGTRTRGLFFVDWERLSREDFENLCFELLTQLGFRRVNWVKEGQEIDISAELPKRDPDGFDYREFWLVSLGRNAPQEKLLEMARRAPDILFRRILSPQLPVPLSQRLPLTILFITVRDLHTQSELFPTDDSVVSRGGFSFRTRLWDKQYLTNLIYQFPQIGLKYFSDEARAQSKYRKTPEELYAENVELTKRLTAVFTALEDERNKRIRAERDAVWKDISFSAAHKIGNPIFAIETNLDPLERRIKEHRTEEAIEVADSIRRSVDKAKAIVDQFKSLSLAQKLNLAPVRLAPVLEGSCSSAATSDVACEISCPPNVIVLGDPERLAECLDELMQNALHWLDKPNPKISITVTLPDNSALPSALDSMCSYALIHFEDNGVGVPAENKSQIFDAFFTTYVHGTGIGLALVRRVIEGHGGIITEVGRPGSGADFEIYIPIPKTEQAVPAAMGEGMSPAKRGDSDGGVRSHSGR
jgi:signal transduction histidine kinase/nucleoside 2-deoxyribosyltransferase